MIPYRAMLDVPAELLRDRTRIEALGRDHGMSRATAYRYVAEAVDVLSEQATGLAEALERALAECVPCVVLDGKVFQTDRCSEPATSVKGQEIDAWYSGKARRHGGYRERPAVRCPQGAASPADRQVRRASGAGVSRARRTGEQRTARAPSRCS